VRLPAQTLAGAQPPHYPLLDSSSLLHSSERCTIRLSERARQGEFRNVQWTCRGEWASRDTLTPDGAASSWLCPPPGMTDGLEGTQLPEYAPSLLLWH